MCDLRFSPKHHRTTAHPLFALFFKPLCNSIKRDMGMAAAAFKINLVVAAIGNVLFFACLRNIGLNRMGALLFTGILAVSFAHFLYGSIPETYIFVSTSLILLLFLFLFLKDYKAFVVSFLPASLLSIGITATNIVFVVILFFFKVHRKSELRKALLHVFAFCLVLGIMFYGLVLLQKKMYPLQKDIFAPTAVSSNTQFLRDHLVRFPLRTLAVRLPHFFLYNEVVPGRIRNVVTFPGWGQVRGITWATMGIYILFMSICVWMLLKLKTERSNAFWPLLAYFGFNICFFLIYGYEPHLYQAHYTFAWVALLAVPFGVENGTPRTARYASYLCMFVLLPLLVLNNWDFLIDVLNAD
jgi:hypothetical protein